MTKWLLISSLDLWDTSLEWFLCKSVKRGRKQWHYHVCFAEELKHFVPTVGSHLTSQTELCEKTPWNLQLPPLYHTPLQFTSASEATASRITYYHPLFLFKEELFGKLQGQKTTNITYQAVFSLWSRGFMQYQSNKKIRLRCCCFCSSWQATFKMYMVMHINVFSLSLQNWKRTCMHQ